MTTKQSQTIKFEDIQKGDIVEYRTGGMKKSLKKVCTGRTRGNIQVKEDRYGTFLLFRHQILSVHRKNYQDQVIEEIIEEIRTEEQIKDEAKKELLARIVQLDNKVTDIEKEKELRCVELAELVARHKTGNVVPVKHKKRIQADQYEIIAVTYELYRGIVYTGTKIEPMSAYISKPTTHKFSEKLTAKYDHYLK